ncbi:MAG: hypothetical protein KatS3mg105_2618 [Gemmatales bacterium]|nr:MAG: hypothetical protein KatS3mg105_2618 [Gemmatales bacterium]
MSVDGALDDRRTFAGADKRDVLVDDDLFGECPGDGNFFAGGRVVDLQLQRADLRSRSDGLDRREQSCRRLAGSRGIGKTAQPIQAKQVRC